MEKLAKRVIGNESLDEGLARLEAQRLSEVRTASRSKWFLGFEKHVFGMNASLKGAYFHMTYEGATYDGYDGDKFTIQLFQQNRPIAYSQGSIRRRDDRIEAVFDVIQGRDRGRQRITRFEEENRHLNALGDYMDGNGQMKWFMVFAKTMVAAAYEAGCDRALLIDITEHKDYKDPFAPEPRHQSVRDAMRTMYGIIRDGCGFGKKEGMYYVREFAPGGK